MTRGSRCTSFCFRMGKAGSGPRETNLISSLRRRSASQLRQMGPSGNRSPNKTESSEPYFKLPPSRKAWPCGFQATFAITSVFQILALQLLGIVATGLWSVCRESVSNDFGLRTLGPFLKVANNFLAEAGYAIERLCSVGIVS